MLVRYALNLRLQRSFSTAGATQLGARDVSFSGTGLLMDFQVGVASVLQVGPTPTQLATL